MAVNARTEEFQHIEVFDKPALFTNGLSNSSGDPSLICQYPDGTMYLIADSQTTSLDTKIPLQAGLNRIRFDGSDSALDFELVYTGLTSPEILGYGQSQSEAETVPSDAPSISGSISDSPDAELHSSASNLFTKVSQPAALLEFQLEKETDITVFVAADLRNNSSGRFKAGVFDVTLKGDNYPDTEIIHHATADSSWGDFLWAIVTSTFGQAAAIACSSSGAMPFCKK